MGKRKVRVYNKINLYETSIVGIPAYPDAHASVESFSLIKSIKKYFSSEYDNIEKVSNQIEEKEVKEKMDQTQPALDTSKEVKTEVDKTVQPVQLTPEAIAEILKSSLKVAMKEFETERGLVSTEKTKSVQEIVKEMSIGELAVANGLFVPK